MQITLRKANALQNAIQEQIKTIDISLTVSLNEFQDVALQVEKARATVIGSDQRRANLTMALYAIRGLVGKANAASGVSDHLAHAAYLDKRIGQLKGLSESTAVEAEAVLDGKLEKLRNTESKNRIYGYGDTVDSGVFTADDIAGFKAVVAHLKKQKQTLQDAVLELNVRNEVVLTLATETTLQAENLL